MTTDQTGKTLEYDAWNRLVDVKSAGVSVSAKKYDATGRRIENDGYKLFHSAQWQVIEERSASNQTTTQYVWSPVYVDAMVLRDRDTNADGVVDQRHYVTHDANFNITALTDASGNVVERYLYDPYAVDADGNVSLDGFHGLSSLKTLQDAAEAWNQEQPEEGRVPQNKLPQLYNND